MFVSLEVRGGGALSVVEGGGERWAARSPRSRQPHLPDPQVDMAFELFRPDEEGHISAAELRRIFCASGGEQLGEDEFSAMLADLGVAADGVIPLHALRNHPSFRA